MGRILSAILLCSFMSFCQAQVKWNGVWQGVMMKDGQKPSEALVFYIELAANGAEITGKTREEAYSTAFYAVQKIKGKSSKHQIEFKQSVIENKKSSSKVTWCSSEFIGVYNDSTGYITGTFKSHTCKRATGKFVLYRSKSPFASGEQSVLGHSWRDQFLEDLKQGRKAPEIRELERQNFKFYPVFFDYDKAEIKEEFKAYLIEMIRVVNGHSDLRIQVTGHTDSDGSEAYNVDLSQRRAEAIRKFFSENGLDLKKLKIDFKGETQPVETNETPEGKQRNRRVDFQFI